MKDMKCRIWDTQNNRFWTDINEAYKGHIEQLLLSPSGDLHLRTMDGITHESVFPNRFIKSWYTGVHDDTDKQKELYDGDIVIVEFTLNGNRIKEKAVITFYTNGWCTDMSPFYPNAREGWIRRIESDDKFIKIGNIHDNPDLLGG